MLHPVKKCPNTIPLRQHPQLSSKSIESRPPTGRTNHDAHTSAPEWFSKYGQSVLVQRGFFESRNKQAGVWSCLVVLGDPFELVASPQMC